jgi:riboflavin-specific deaminase-like protein
MRRLFPTAAELPDPSSLEEEYLVAEVRHLRANFVMSIDGMVEVGGRSSPLGGAADRAAFMAMRAVADAILVGAGTVRAENYGPVQLEPAVTERRLERDQTDLPVLAIVSNRADLSLTARVFSGDRKPLVLTSAASAALRGDLAGSAEVVVCGEKEVDLAIAIDELSDRGLPRVLCEGGPTLLRSLLEAQRLDELCVTTAPALIGPGHRGLLGEGSLSDTVRLHLTAVLEGDGMIFSRYSDPSYSGQANA